MDTQAKANKIAEILDALYPHPPIPLLHHNPYTLLISVLLSAQCTDLRVNQVTPQLFAKASEPSKMICLTVDEIQQIIRPCGLSARKAKAIWDLSHILLEQFNGQVPQSFADLEALPGVGHKTASVVMAQAFGIPAFPVDTHIHRCSLRWGLSTGASVVHTERALKALFPKEKWNTLHLQIIYFGREYCQARKHIVEKCPICSILTNSRCV